MDRFNSILVDIDAMATAHPAMDRGVELAHTCGAKLKIVDVLALPSEAGSSLPKDAEALLVRARHDRLATIAGAVESVAIEFDVLRGRPSMALVQEVLRSSHDLLIRSHARDLAAPKALRAIDMELFRQCPCPVWAVGPGVTSAPRRVLAALRADPEDAEDEALNRKIIETALLMARFEGGTLVVCQTWTAFGEDLLRSHAKREDVVAYRAAAEQAAREHLDRLVNGFGARLASARIELRKGHPEDTIPPFVVSAGIDLIVTGTRGRDGIAGFLTGNTAERLLQRLVCSILVIKPDGFRPKERFGKRSGALDSSSTTSASRPPKAGPIRTAVCGGRLGA